MFALKRSQQLVAQSQRRTFMVWKNDILERQRIMQKGSTPYLRGWEDPTFLRLWYDKPKSIAFGVVVVVGWLWALRAHSKMWVGDRS